MNGTVEKEKKKAGTVSLFLYKLKSLQQISEITKRKARTQKRKMHSKTQGKKEEESKR